jgi:3-phenylpropionate/trans-cinnamate dioxygenase ferredoxin reductase subunit
MLGPDSAVVIVGAGQAGFQAAASLRELGYAGRVVLVGDEACLPYQRPPLSKAHLKAEAEDHQLHFRPDTFFAERAIELRAPERVTAIARAARRVALASGGELAYDHLVLATGARPRRPAWPGMALDGVHVLRTVEDARRIRACLQPGARVVVVGAGFIGLEVAATARAAGLAVTVIEFAERPLKRALSTQTGAWLQQAHASRGVEFLMRTSVATFEGDGGRIRAVTTTDGRRLDADLVLVGIGVEPNIELAAAAGLAVEDGIVVDTHLLTADPAISAIGDCARYPSAHHPGAVRLESVQNAADQARAVAARLAGRPAAYDKLPWFWSDQGDLRVQMCGLAQEGDDVVLRGSLESGRFSVLRYRGDRLVAVETVNQPAEHMMLRKLLGAGVALDRAQAADSAFKLASLVAPVRAAGSASRPLPAEPAAPPMPPVPPASPVPPGPPPPPIGAPPSPPTRSGG